MRFGFLSSVVMSAVVYFGIGLVGAVAQPSATQVKKDVSGPKTISVTVLGKGTKVWSKGYSKYVWDVPYSAKVRSEEPGVNILVQATASYDIVGGRYVYWRSFVGENTYEGIPNPTAADIADLIGRLGQKEVVRYREIVGPVESLELSKTPNFEWHNLNSVSLDIIGVYTEKVTYTETRRVARKYRTRIYRDNKNSPWKSLIVMNEDEFETLPSK